MLGSFCFFGHTLAIVNLVSMYIENLLIFKGWFKRWIYENGDKESILGLRKPTISETINVLLCLIVCGCFTLILSELNPRHDKIASYKIESGKTTLIYLSNIAKKHEILYLLIQLFRYILRYTNYIHFIIESSWPLKLQIKQLAEVWP